MIRNARIVSVLLIHVILSFGDAGVVFFASVLQFWWWGFWWRRGRWRTGRSGKPRRRTSAFCSGLYSVLQQKKCFSLMSTKAEGAACGSGGRVGWLVTRRFLVRVLRCPWAKHLTLTAPDELAVALHAWHCRGWGNVCVNGWMSGSIVKRFEWPLVRKVLYEWSPFTIYVLYIYHRNEITIDL